MALRYFALPGVPVFTLALLAPSLTACPADPLPNTAVTPSPSAAAGTVSTTTTDVRTVTVTQTDPAADYSYIAGTWESACISEFLAGSKYTYVFGQNGEFRIDHTSYEDDTCTANTEDFVSTRRGTYVLGGDGGAAGSKKIDYTTSSVLIAILNSDHIQTNRDSQSCGFSDWTVDVAHDVIGLNCTFGQEHAYQKNEKEYDLVKVTNNQLVFGKRLAQSSGFGGDTSRPLDLDTQVFTKK